jgi:anti-sigma B factor antagonist
MVSSSARDRPSSVVTDYTIGWPTNRQLAYADYRLGMPNDAVVTYEQMDADGLVVASLRGDLDLDQADAVRDSLAAAAADEKCHYLHVDVAAVTFIDSYALGALVSARNSAASRGVSFTLANPSRQVRKAVQVTGLSHVFGLPA